MSGNSQPSTPSTSTTSSSTTTPSTSTASSEPVNLSEQRKMQQQMGVWIAGTLLALGVIVGGIITLFTHQLNAWAILLMLGTVIAFAVFVFKGYTSERFEWTGFGQYKGPEDRDHQPRMLIVLLPALWSSTACPTDYCQGASITANWQTVNSKLKVSITGTIATLNVSSIVTLTPPANNIFSAQVSTVVSGSVKLDNRPGEAFKPVMLSSMHISPTQWDSQAAFIGSHTYRYPARGWIVQLPVVTNGFGLQGGTSAWKTNVPTVEILLNPARQVTGWVTQSGNPNDDNIAFWCATSKVLPSWSFSITAEAGQTL